MFFLRAAGLSMLLAGGQPSAAARKMTPVEELATAHSKISVGPDRIGGPGAIVLLPAIRQARLIGIGEDHVTNEIPSFVSALCDTIGPRMAGLVLEVGPRALEHIRPIIAATDRLARMKSFNANYPSAIAFLDTRADNDLAAHCLKRQPHLKLIGIDQEFFGSGGLLLDMILGEPLSAEARRSVLHLKKVEMQHRAIAAHTGSPSDLLMYKISQADIASTSAALRAGGTPKARRIFSEFLESRKIYLMEGNASNLERARLLKANLRRQMPRAGKVIVKMGDWHLYRGYNPLNNRDLGNALAELGDAEGQASLHILLLGVKGTHAAYGGYDRPFEHQAFEMASDKDYEWLRPAIEASVGGGGGGGGAGDWDMFDLRKLRNRPINPPSLSWRKVLDGYDFLILIPDLTPSQHI